MTEDELVDRVRSVVAGLSYDEAVSLDFSKQPAGAIDRVFRVGYTAQTPNGGFGLTEEARGVVEVAIARSINDDYQAARRAVLQDARAVLRALVRDGSQTSGAYAVEDSGRNIETDAPKGAAYIVGRMLVPVNFEATL